MNIDTFPSWGSHFSPLDKSRCCLKYAIMLQDVDQVALVLQDLPNHSKRTTWDSTSNTSVFLTEYFDGEVRNPRLLELLLRHFKSDLYLEWLDLCSPSLEEFELIIDWYLDNHVGRANVCDKISEMIFVRMHDYDMLKIVLAKNIPLRFDKDMLAFLINTDRADKYYLINSLALQYNELMGNFCLEFIAENNKQKADLLLSCGLSLVGVDTWRFVHLYNIAHSGYCWLIEKLALQEPIFFKRRGSGLLQKLLYSDRREQDRASWLHDLEELLAAGAPPWGDLYEPLILAHKMKMVDVCKLFVKHLGKDPNNTVLHKAVLEGDTEAIKENIDFIHHEKNFCFQTPFDLVIENNSVNLFPLFLPFCDLFTKMTLTESIFCSRNPMHVAADAGHKEMMHMLWHLGCSDLHPEDVKNFTTIWGRPAIEVIFEACINDDLDCIKVALEKHPLLLHACYKRKSILARAVECNALKTVQFLAREKTFNTYEFKHLNIHNKESSPLYLALAYEKDLISSCLLESIHLPTLAEIKLCQEKFNQEVYDADKTFFRILRYLIMDRKEAAIFFLAAHDKTANKIKSEGLCYLLKYKWCDLNLIERLLKKGFDANGRIFGEDASPLKYAIDLNNIPLVRLLLNYGAILKSMRAEDEPSLLPPLIQAANNEGVDGDMMLFLMGEYLKRNIPLPWDIILIKGSSLKHEKRLFAQFLHYHTHLKEEAGAVAQNFSKLVFDPKLDIADAAPGLLFYGAKHLKSKAEWFLLFRQVRELVENLSALQASSKAASLIDQLFYHVLCGINSKLQQEPQVIERISQMLLSHLGILEDKLLLALQVGPSLCQIEGAMKMAAEIHKGISLPSSVLFNMQGSSQKFDDVATMKNALDYIGVFRAREGLPHCLKAIKYQTMHPEVVLKALQALERIAIGNLNKEFKDAQIKRIIPLLSANLPMEVKVQGCQAIWALSQNEKDEHSKSLFTTILETLDCSHLQQKSYALTLIELLGHFVYTDSLVGTRAASLLRKYMHHPDVDIAFQATLSVSKTNHLDGLKDCLRVINSAVWQRYVSLETSHDKHVAGTFLMFRERPAALHDNRLTMQLRILDRIAHVHWKQPGFQSAIEEILLEFKQDPSSNPELQEFSIKFQNIPKSRTRFIGLPLYLPEGSLIARGLSCRKGEEQFYESIRDLLRKGCGTTDLTLETARVAGQTWSRIGHIFASHNAELFNHGSTYFNGTNSALLLVNADFYNLSYMKGEARMESEHTFNMVWYNGIPKQYLQAIYLEEKHQPDILLLAGNSPIKEVKDRLVSPIFKDQTLKELVYLRRHLQAKELICVQGEEKLLSLAERIFFYNSSQEPALLLASIEKSLGRKFSTEEEVFQASLRRTAARQLVRTQYL